MHSHKVAALGIQALRSGKNASSQYSNGLLVDQALAQRRRRRTGNRPAKADEAYPQMVVEVREEEPEELGFRLTMWTD